MSRMMTKLEQWWQSERRRQFLWLPVVFGIGIGIYYGLPVEPPLYLLPILWLAALAGTILLRHRARVPMLALLLIISGATWSQIRTAWNPEQVLHESLGVRPVIGTVNDIVRTEHGLRFTLGDVRIDELPAEETPKQIRLSVRLKAGAPEAPLPNIGDSIGMRAGLLPPMGPALPHGFDFARYFYFRDLGGVGYGLPPWVVIAPKADTGLTARFMNWRLGLTEDIIKTLGTGPGGVAAGLITGDARAITQKDFDDLRASNLYHIIAISGEHMVVIAGVIFVMLRLTSLLILPRRVSLRPQAKTVAACITLALVSIYLCITGLPISAVRAYVMIFLVLLAVILRRQVEPMRSLAITAFVMLVIDPANLLDPGFELSFAATLALISLFEVSVLRKDVPDGMRLYKYARFFAAMILVSVVAEIATLPIVISQFNNVAPYGVFANMLATPVMSFYLMPTVALYFILLPFGLSHIALWLMKWGVIALLGIGRWVASFPHAQLFAPALPGWGVALFALGLCWICFWQTRTRRYGAIAMVLGYATILLHNPPDMLIGSGIKQLALKTPEGYGLARGRATSMVPNLWANGLGYTSFEKADEPAWRCDRAGCIAQVRNHIVAVPADASALLEDCTHADIILAKFKASCPGHVHIIDVQTLEENNVTALWFGRSGHVRIESSNDWQGTRPWSAHPVEEDETDD